MGNKKIAGEFVEKSEGRALFGSLGCRRWNNIKEIWCEVVVRIGSSSSSEFLCIWQ
jgi:hypothetical protein